MNKKNLTRRSLLKMGLGTSMGLAGVHAMGAACGWLTPAQPEGPFYPIVDQSDKDYDLTQVKGHAQKAKGERIQVRGAVTDRETCQPIEGALVEIWQACHSGRYNHTSDPNTVAELDPHFQYWGRAITSAKGSYEFYTIKPGPYPATEDWIRPAHIHFKIHMRGYRELTTQMYFKGDPYNESDRILRELTPVEQQQLIVDFDKEGFNEEFKKVGRFDIQLEKMR